MMKNRKSNFIRIPSLAYLLWSGYCLSHRIADQETSTFSRQLFVIWGYAIIVIVALGFLAWIKNNYFTKTKSRI
jgi:hypothetical protein